MPQANALSSTTNQLLVLTLFGLFVALSPSSQAQFQGTLVLTDEQDEYPLGLHLEILKDPTRKFTIEEVTSAEFDRKFIQNKTRVLNPGLVDSAYWIRFQVNNQAHQTSEWWLEIAGFEIAASLYYPRPDGRPGFEVKHAGWTPPTSKGKKTHHLYPAFRLPFTSGSEQTIYLRVDGQRLNLPLTLWSGTGFARESQKDLLITGFYWGVFLIMAGYNFFLFLALRDKSYLYYVLFMIFALSAVVLRIAQTNPTLNLINLAVATLMVVFLLRFAGSFLVAKAHAPRLDRILNGLQIGVGATGLLYIVSSRAILFIQIWFALVLFGLAVILITSLVTWRRGYRPARFFVLAQTILLVAFFYKLLAYLGYAPLIYAEHIPKIGVSLMAVLMSLALADRINTIRKERELAETETSQRNRELILLNQVIAATTTAVKFETVLETVCRELGRAFHLTYSIAGLSEENNSAVRIAADYHAEDRPSILGQSLPVEGNPLLEHINTHKAPLIVEDAQNDPRTTSIRQIFHRPNTTSLLVFPLIVEKEVLGASFLGSSNPGHFSADKLGLVQSVAEQMAGVLIRIRLVEERQQLEAQYYQSQKMDAIGVLAGGIAHDFNNLLVPIIGYTETAMIKLTPGDKLYANINNVFQAATQAAALTRQILTFSRKQVLEMRPVYLNNIVTDFHDILRRLIGEDIELHLFLSSSLHPIKADRGQIEQILLNLTVNAREAMPKGGKLIIETNSVILDEKYAEAHAGVIAGPYVILAVSDNGCGMDYETKSRVFEPFFTTKEPGKGTGLGLATVHGIVKQHGGHVWIYSEPNRGTSFKIYFPQTSEPVLSESPLPEYTPQVVSKSVLVVEDERAVRDLLSGVLKSYGYKVLKAENPERALAILSTYSAGIDLLLTDVIMPGMNGVELYNRVSAIYPEMKVLYISGYTRNMIMLNGVLEEGINYLQKPFTIRDLTQKVRQVLDQ